MSEKMKRSLQALVLLISGIVLGFCQGYGIFKIPQPRLMFELMMLLTFTCLAIWAIRKRVEKKRES